TCSTRSASAGRAPTAPARRAVDRVHDPQRAQARLPLLLSFAPRSEMSSKKRRPQARKGRTASAARAGGRKTDRTSWIAAGVILLVGILLVVIMRPSSSSAGVALGDHWHAALGVYAC